MKKLSLIRTHSIHFRKLSQTVYLSFMLSNLASVLVQSHHPQRTLMSVAAAAAELAVQQ